MPAANGFQRVEIAFSCSGFHCLYTYRYLLEGYESIIPPFYHAVVRVKDKPHIKLAWSGTAALKRTWYRDSRTKSYWHSLIDYHKKLCHCMTTYCWKSGASG